MSDIGESMEQRRARFTATIAKQRGDFAQAYQDIAKPILYVDYGIRGFGFLRSNPWMLTVVPAAFSITGTLVGIARNKSPKPVLRPRKGEKSEDLPKGMLGRAMKWGRMGWSGYKVFRRVRGYFSP